MFQLALSRDQRKRLARLLDLSSVSGRLSFIFGDTVVEFNVTRAVPLAVGYYLTGMYRFTNGRSFEESNKIDVIVVCDRCGECVLPKRLHFFRRQRG